MIMRVECPRCGKVWGVPEGTDSIVCNCHEYCEDGDKPADCTLVSHTDTSVPDRWTGKYNPPQGMHFNRDNNGDDTVARLKYCTVHSKFVTKVPFTIDLNWKTWQKKKIQDKLKWHKGEI